jgi:hypothetical protein
MFIVGGSVVGEVVPEITFEVVAGAVTAGEHVPVIAQAGTPEPVPPPLPLLPPPPPPLVVLPPPPLVLPPPGGADEFDDKVAVAELTALWPTEFAALT